MGQNYAELSLYMGICDSRGVSERKFDVNREDDYSRNRHTRAMKIVKETLDSAAMEDGWGYSLGYGYFNFVDSDSEARKLLDYALINIPQSEGIIELFDCCHGTIRFCRKIRFNGIVSEDKNTLAIKLEVSGLIPGRSKLLPTKVGSISRRA